MVSIAVDAEVIYAGRQLAMMSGNDDLRDTLCPVSPLLEQHATEMRNATMHCNK